MCAYVEYQQIHTWFFNRTRGSGGGGGRGTRKLAISKKRAPLQAYMHYYYQSKIKAQVIRLWKQANYGQRTSALEQDRHPDIEAQDDDEELDEDTETKGIPFSFKMKISKEMWSIESESVKIDVEKRRTEDSVPPELADNEEMRVARLVTYQEYVTI